jgi:flagellar basal body-associated protein FliL
VKKPARVHIRILLAILAAEILLVAAVAALSPRTPPPAAAAPPRPTAGSPRAQEKQFLGLGRIRAPLAAAAPAAASIVVISPYFPYDPADRAFSEELAARIGDCRRATLDFFAAIPPSSPILNNDDAIKSALLERYNAQLRLGKIERLYFTDYMIID